MKDIIIPTGSLITRKIEEGSLTIHSPKRKKNGMIIFYQVLSVLIMAFLVLAIVTTITSNPISILYTLPVWPVAVFLFRLGRKAATLEEWIVITEKELVIRKQNFSYLKEWKIPLESLQAIMLKKVGIWSSIKNMSYYVRRGESEHNNTLYPTIAYKEHGKKSITFFENATDKEMKWIVDELQKLVPEH